MGCCPFGWCCGLVMECAVRPALNVGARHKHHPTRSRAGHPQQPTALPPSAPLLPTLHSVPAGPDEEGGLDEKGRLEMAARLAAPEQFPNQEEQLQVCAVMRKCSCELVALGVGSEGHARGAAAHARACVCFATLPSIRPASRGTCLLHWAACSAVALLALWSITHPTSSLSPHVQGALCFLSSQELQCLLGYIITRHSAALGPRSGAGAAGSELLSSSSAAAAAAASSSGSGSSGSSSAGDDATDEEQEGSITPDLASPSQVNRAFALNRADLPPEPSLASYDPGCASVFQFAADAGGGSGGGGDDSGSGSPGRALLRQQLVAAAQQPGSIVAELHCGRELRWVLAKPSQAGGAVGRACVRGRERLCSDRGRENGPQHRALLAGGVARLGGSVCHVSTPSSPDLWASLCCLQRERGAGAAPLVGGPSVPQGENRQCIAWPGTAWPGNVLAWHCLACCLLLVQQRPAVPHACCPVMFALWTGVKRLRFQRCMRLTSLSPPPPMHPPFLLSVLARLPGRWLGRDLPPAVGVWQCRARRHRCGPGWQCGVLPRMGGSSGCRPPACLHLGNPAAAALANARPSFQPHTLPSNIAEEFLERQRLATGPKGCDASVMSCLSELAEVWRQLAAATARKRHLQSLRDGVREEAAAVRSFEEAGAAALHSQVWIGATARGHERANAWQQCGCLKRRWNVSRR